MRLETEHAIALLGAIYLDRKLTDSLTNDCPGQQALQDGVEALQLLALFRSEVDKLKPLRDEEIKTAWRDVHWREPSTTEDEDTYVWRTERAICQAQLASDQKELLEKLEGK